MLAAAGGAAGVLLAAVAAAGLGRLPGRERFGIYRSGLDGSGMRLLLSDPSRQMSHIRMSPDWAWLTFTRYNRKGWLGLAEEESGYAQTEVLVARSDGSGVRTVIPAKKGVLACNSSWTPDGKSLIFLSTDNPQRRPSLLSVDLKTGHIAPLPVPDRLAASDPQRVGGRVVFAVKGEGLDAVWLMDADGGRARPLTAPKIPPPQERDGFNLGDYDPKLSPDGRRVVLMRHFGKDEWHAVVVDAENGREYDLSVPGAMDGIPEWSPDGSLLVFWHADRKRLQETGVYTMRPDGSERRMLPLPRGYLHGHPIFVPGTGKEIMFSAKRIPWLQ